RGEWPLSQLAPIRPVRVILVWAWRVNAISLAAARRLDAAGLDRVHLALHGAGVDGAIAGAGAVAARVYRAHGAARHGADVRHLALRGGARSAGIVGTLYAPA